ncbi:MAG: acyl-CoA thioesterase [Sphingobium sp.]
MTDRDIRRDRSVITLSPVAADGMAWDFSVEDRLCAGPRGKPFLFGGSALAAAVEALERSIGRPVIWANAQYHSFAVPGMVLRLTAEAGGTGKRLTQARLVGEAAGVPVISVQATLGASTTKSDGQWIEAPRVASWRDSPVVTDHRVYQTGINTLFEFRLAGGRYPDGHMLDGKNGGGRLRLWVRPVSDHPLDRPMLAIIADYISVVICDAIGREVGANSLDNMVRFTGPAQGEWVLADIALDRIMDGIAHGGLRLFSEEGSLIATASTSLVVRE